MDERTFVILMLRALYFIGAGLAVAGTALTTVFLWEFQQRQWDQRKIELIKCCMVVQAVFGLTAGFALIGGIVELSSL